MRKRLTSATLKDVEHPVAKKMNRFEAHLVELLKDHNLSEAMDLMGEWQKSQDGVPDVCVDCNTPEQWKVEERERERKRRNDSIDFGPDPFEGMDEDEITEALDEEAREYLKEKRAGGLGR